MKQRVLLVSGVLGRIVLRLRAAMLAVLKELTIAHNIGTDPDRADVGWVIAFNMAFEALLCFKAVRIFPTRGT